MKLSRLLYLLPMFLTVMLLLVVGGCKRATNAHVKSNEAIESVKAMLSQNVDVSKIPEVVAYKDEAVDPLIEALDQCEDAKAIGAISTALLQINSTKVREGLIALSKSKNRTSRANAALCLSMLPTESEIQVRLIELADDPESEVQASALGGLSGNLADQKVGALLERKLSSNDRTVRIAAASVFGRFGDERGLSTLIKESKGNLSALEHDLLVSLLKMYDTPEAHEALRTLSLR